PDEAGGEAGAVFPVGPAPPFAGPARRTVAGLGGENAAPPTPSRPGMRGRPPDPPPPPGENARGPGERGLPGGDGRGPPGPRRRPGGRRRHRRRSARALPAAGGAHGRLLRPRTSRSRLAEQEESEGGAGRTTRTGARGSPTGKQFLTV